MKCASVLHALVCGVVLQVADVWAAGVACGDDPADAAAVAAARAEIAGTCNCAGVPDHRTYVRCASAVLTVRAGSNQLRSACKGEVKRCASRSTCGRAGAVTCCRTNAAGRLRCSVKNAAARCRAPKGGTACVGTVSTCCDACGSGDCVPTTTSSSTTTSTSTTSTTVASACGDTYPSCNGSCPPDMHCAPDESFPPTSCVCVPTGVVPCSSATYPECGGTCSGGAVCAPVQIYFIATGGQRYCACLDPASDCTGTFGNGMCPGLCPTPGTACYAEPEPIPLGGCVGCIPDNFP